MIVVGIDVGGTFTDAVAWDTASGEKFFAKVLSTPDDPPRAFFDALGQLGIALDSVARMVHGTTLATNTVVERRGARIGLIATDGHRDTLDIRRGIRPFGHIHDLLYAPPPPLVRRGLRVGVRGRMDANGAEVEPLAEADIAAAIAFFAEHEVEAVAVAFLFSYANDAHERRVEELVHASRPDLPVSLSSRILPQWHEYERTNTTVADAYMKPAMMRYLERLADDLERHGFKRDLHIMKSNGGVMTARRAAAIPIETYLSGPAGGVVAGYHVGRQTERAGLIVTDMGGTSFEVSVVTPSGYTTTTESEIGLTMPIMLPMLDVRTIGAGGGSIAWLDPGGALKVGPHSAGALPGPASYGRGGEEPTVTDANVILGRLPADRPLAGDLSLDAERARAALAPLAERLGGTIERAAEGIVRICVANMVGQIRAVTSERGLHPRDFALLAGGGAGPLHGAQIAAELGIGTVVVPAYPGLLSAVGLIQSDIRLDFVRSFPARLDEHSFRDLCRIMDELEQEGRRALHEEGHREAPTIEASVEMRYVGQNWQIRVPFDAAGGAAGLAGAFDAEHNRLYGFSLDHHAREFIDLRVAAVGVNAEADRLTPTRVPQGRADGAETQFWDGRADRFEVGQVFDRDGLAPGWRATGPLAIAGVDAVVWVPPRVPVLVDAAGNLELDVGSAL